MATGMEMMLATVMKSLPKEAFEGINNIGKIAVNVMETLARIEKRQIANEAKLDAILNHLGVTENGTETGSRDGSGERGNRNAA